MNFKEFINEIEVCERRNYSSFKKKIVDIIDLKNISEMKVIKDDSYIEEVWGANVVVEWYKDFLITYKNSDKSNTVRVQYVYGDVHVGIDDQSISSFKQ